MPQPSLILGPLPALEDALADAVSSARASDPLAPVTVLVGQSLLKRYLPRMLASRGAPQINTRFLLPDELVASLAAQGAQPMTRMSRAAERLIARIAAELPGPYFADAARSEGFVTAVVRLSRELERGSFDPAALRGLLDVAGVSAPKAEHLSAIYAELSHLRAKARLAGPAQFQEAPDVGQFEGALIVYGLWDPAAGTLSLLEQLSAQHDITVLLPAYTEQQDEYAPFQQWLQARGASIRRIDGTDGQSLAHRVLQPPHPGEPANVELISAPNIVREAWEAARKCIAWAEQGIPFHEMAVVYRHRDQHRALIDEIFREAEIPTYLHDGAPLAEHPLGRRLIALLDLVAEDQFSRHRVMEFVTEAHLPRATRDAYAPVRPAEWDSYSRDAGVVEGIEQWRSRLGRLSAHHRESARTENYEWLAEHADRVDVLLRFIEDLHKALGEKPEVGTWEQHLSFIQGLADRYAEGLDPILKVLPELRSLAPVQPIVTFELFAQTVREDLQSRDVTRVLGEPVREFGRHGVAVMDASSLRHMRFRAVYLLGLSERSWPAPARPDPLLLEHERTALNGAAAEAAHIPLRNTPDEEPLTFRLAVDAATSHLVASYARAQASRSSRHVPSYFFRSLAESIAGRPLSAQELDHGGVVRRLAAGRLSVEPLTASLTAREYDRGLVQHSDQANLGNVVAALNLGDSLLTRRSRWNRELTPYDGVLASDDARQVAAELQFGRKAPVSASRLELYARCPYQYFLRYVLRIQPLDEPEAIDGIDHLERGSLIHAILERFLKELAGEPPSEETRDRHVAILRRVIDDESAEREARGVTGRPLAWAIEKRQIVEDLLRWYDAEVREGSYTSLRPTGFEVRFGPGYRFADETQDEDPLSSDEPLVVDAEGVSLQLQGRIDRIDTDADKARFRVIDYKTGGTRDRAAPDRGRALQLPLYLLAASKLLNIPVENGEAQYFYCTRRGDYHRSTFTGDDLNQRQDDIALVLRTIADGVDGGYFAPNPGKSAENCRFCDYKFVCNAGIDRIIDRKQQDGPAASFIALQDIK